LLRCIDVNESSSIHLRVWWRTNNASSPFIINCSRSLERLCLSFLRHLYTQQGCVLCRTVSIILEKQEENEILDRARSRPKFEQPEDLAWDPTISGPIRPTLGRTGIPSFAGLRITHFPRP